MHEHFSEQSQGENAADLLPPCCGTGCAVCVLDMAGEYAVAVTALPAEMPPNERVQCCNTGCLICVRDYPELAVPSNTSAQMLQLLEAVETAQQS